MEYVPWANLLPERRTAEPSLVSTAQQLLRCFLLLSTLPNPSTVWFL